MKRYIILSAITGLAVVVATILIVRRLQYTRDRRIAFTMGEMHSLGVALQQFAHEHSGLYPSPPVAPMPDLLSYESAIKAFPACPPFARATADWVHPYIRQFYTSRAVPLNDAWGRRLLCSVSRDQKQYIIVSLGSDGSPDSACSNAWPEKESWHDLMFIDGSFVSAPSGWPH